MFRLQPDNAVSVLVSLIRDDAPEAAALARDYGNPNDAQGANKPQSLLARAMLRRMLCEATGTAGSEWSFARGENARPLAFHRSGPSPFVISLAHSGRYVAAAIAQAERIGIDIEQQTAWPDPGGVALLAFGPEEREQARQEGLPAFYRIWTLREAFAKATGIGLEQAADGQDRFTAPTAPDTLARAALPGYWFVGHGEPVPGVSCAVAVEFARVPPSAPVWLWR